ncbi:MAG: S41 family peptidase [Paludibacteraceae bacterium]
MNKRILPIVFGWLVILSVHSCMREPDVKPNTNRGNFDTLWEIIDSRYCYLDYKNIDWNDVYARYSPSVDTISNKLGLFDLFAEMLAELKDGHVNLYSEFDRSRYWDWYTDYPANFDSEVLFNSRYLGENYRIAGPFRYGKIANGQVGYLYYGSFSNSFGNSSIKSIFSQFSDCKGLIIDVRNNGGGMVTNSDLLSSYFFKEKTLIGYVAHKTGKGHSDFSRPTPLYSSPHELIRWERPVVILTNRLSYSATNEFVCRMKYAPYAVIVGDSTGGGGGMPLSSELPNGWMVRFSASPMYDAEMNHTEWGINPDIHAEMDSLDKANGIDSIIETAVKEILK